MNILVLLAVAAGLVGLRYVDLKVRPVHILIWMAVWLVAVYLVLRFGIDPPVPTSVIGMFLGIMVLVLLTYLTARTEHLEASRGAVVRFVA